MNENVNLCEILMDCPKGTKLYSPLYGEVELVEIEFGDKYPIAVHVVGGDDDDIYHFAADGLYDRDHNGEILLFPSKSQKNWDKFKCPKKPKFDPKTLQPFDKVLARYNSDDMWKVDFYSHKGVIKTYPYRCIGSPYTYCIPYNEDTKHLVGTTDEAPEYYRYWED